MKTVALMILCLLSTSCAGIKRCREMHAERKLIKAIMYGFVVFLCTSCTFMYSPAAGMYSSIGGDAVRIDFRTDGFAVAEVGNSKAFEQAKKSLQAYFFWRGVSDLAGIAADVNKVNQLGARP